MVTDPPDWSAATWEGARRAQIRRALRLTVRERLEALEHLSETSARLAQSAPVPPLSPTSARDAPGSPDTECADASPPPDSPEG